EFREGRRLQSPGMESETHPRRNPSNLLHGTEDAVPDGRRNERRPLGWPWLEPPVLLESSRRRNVLSIANGRRHYVLARAVEGKRLPGRSPSRSVRNQTPASTNPRAGNAHPNSIRRVQNNSRERK